MKYTISVAIEIRPSNYGSGIGGTSFRKEGEAELGSFKEIAEIMEALHILMEKYVK